MDNREQWRKYMRAYREKHPQVIKKNNLRERGYRLELMDKLGGRKCVRCGYSDNVQALSIDHKNGDGKQQKDKIIPKGGIGKLWRYYLAHPETLQGLQVLCQNCNWIKKWENKEYGNGLPKKTRMD